MSFSKSKCKVMHIGVKNPNYCYKLMRPELTVTDEERDIEVMVNNLMKELTLCIHCKKKRGGGQQRVRDNKKQY